MRRILGIDPGVVGGLAVLDLDVDDVAYRAELHRTPRVEVKRNKRWRLDYDPVAMRELLARALDGGPLHTIAVALEAQGARPQQGTASSYRTGLGFGLWLGLLVGARVAYHVITPQVWKRHAGLRGADKHAARLQAQRLFPFVGAIAPADEGPAEALLLASYLAATHREGAPHGTRRVS